MARSWIVGAKTGHKLSEKMLKKFGTLIEGDITRMEGPELENALNQMAKNFTDRNQGTYSGEGLPTWTSEGQLAPFLALQKWSIEKSNVIFQDVIKPFYTGENRIPLLTYTLGSVLTGAGIQQLNKLLSGKDAPDPTIAESLDKGDFPAMAAQLATILSLASYGGIIGDSVKILSDASKGKTPRNPLSFPAYSSTADAASQIKNAVMAIKDGENPIDILGQLAVYLSMHNVQALRLVGNRVNADETERANKFRDVRVFNELEGETARAIQEPNRFQNAQAKQFKRTGNLQEAAGMLPELVNRAQQKASGNSEKLRKAFSSLSGNSYQTFPSFNESPMEFQQYYSFLVRTKGQEAADARMQDYMRQTTINSIKSSFVPRL